jgi:GT2 family glycosyltransferase
LPALTTTDAPAANPGILKRPVEVSPTEVAVRFPRVAAIIVTWNRHKAVDSVLRALARQAYPMAELDVVVVDNASTDDTGGFLYRQWHPDRVFDNPTLAADKPDFTRAHQNGTANGNGSHPPHPFRSLTLIRNKVNHGGCGGFNTGLAYAGQFLDPAASPLDYVWLVDDDIDLPESALAQLTRTGESDPEIGIVGSRTVDYDDRKTTIETTIYFDFENGWMGPDPTPDHRLFGSHKAWVESVGGTRGQLPFRSIREVDVVSACSLLARWSAVKKVGLWDRRYFIYCDDADWCLRFAKAGYRVVCDLDAVVYHTHWLAKLTPARAYYSQRNLVWLTQKVMTGPALKRATLRRLGNLLVDSRKAMTHCRLFAAEIIRRTAHDIVTNHGGRLDFEGPPFIPIMDALEAAGALHAEARVLVMCSHPESIQWAEDLRARTVYALMDRGRVQDSPRWIYLVRDVVPDDFVSDDDSPGVPHRIRFEPNRNSKWQAQRGFLLHPPTAVVLFDQNNECPMVRSRVNIHIDRRRMGQAQVERDGLMPRLSFMGRWLVTALRCTLYGLRVRPFISSDRYG